MANRGAFLPNHLGTFTGNFTPEVAFCCDTGTFAGFFVPQLAFWRATGTFTGNFAPEVAPFVEDCERCGNCA